MLFIKKYKWILVAFLAAILAAPNPAIIKFATSNADAHFYNLSRYSLLVILTLPYVLKNKHHFKNPAIKNSIRSGLFMSIAVICFVLAISLSEASYVKILDMLGPVSFIIYSSRMTSDKINRRSMFGVGVALIGAMVIVLLPLLLQQHGTFKFYPVATLFLAINILSYPLAVIYSRRANEAKIPMLFSVTIMGWCVAVVNMFMFLIFGGGAGPTTGATGFWLAVAYSGIIVVIAARVMAISAYERIGAAASSTIGYFESFLAILIAIVFLDEKLSPATIIGGLIILIGIYIVQSGHKHLKKHHKHWHLPHLH